MIDAHALEFRINWDIYKHLKRMLVECLQWYCHLRLSRNIGMDLSWFSFPISMSRTRYEVCPMLPVLCIVRSWLALPLSLMFISSSLEIWNRKSPTAWIVSGLIIIYVCEMAFDLKFEDSKEVFGSRTSKEDRQYNGQNEKRQKDKQLSRKYYAKTTGRAKLTH